MSLTEYGQTETEGDVTSMDVVAGEYLVTGMATGKIEVKRYFTTVTSDEAQTQPSPSCSLHGVPCREGREPPLPSLQHNTSISAAAIIREIPITPRPSRCSPDTSCPGGGAVPATCPEGAFAAAWMDGRICVCRIQCYPSGDEQGGETQVDWQATQCFHTRYSFYRLDYFPCQHAATAPWWGDVDSSRICLHDYTHDLASLRSDSHVITDVVLPIDVPEDCSEGGDVEEATAVSTYTPYIVATSLTGHSIFVSLLSSDFSQVYEPHHIALPFDDGSDSNRQVLAFDSCHAFECSLSAGVCAGTPNGRMFALNMPSLSLLIDPGVLAGRFRHIAASMHPDAPMSPSSVGDTYCTPAVSRAETIVSLRDDSAASPPICRTRSRSRSHSLDSILSLEEAEEAMLGAASSMTTARPSLEPSAGGEGPGESTVDCLVYLSSKGEIHVVYDVDKQLSNIGPPILSSIPLEGSMVECADNIAKAWTYAKVGQ